METYLANRRLPPPRAAHAGSNATLGPAVSRPGDPANAVWHGATGRVVSLLPGLLAGIGADPARTIAYVCGNPGMTEAASAVLTAWGMPAAAIRSETYWVAAKAA
jgi:hypothetical protein